jgi:hypothetical protein
MKLRHYLVTSAIGLCLSIFSSQQVQAQTQNPCPISPIVEPATQTREINIKKFGVTFKIPSNYKTRTYSNSTDFSVAIYNPSLYQFLSCAINNNIPVEDRLDMLAINLGQVEPGSKLIDIANSKYGFRSLKITNVKNITINNRSAITYTHETVYSEYTGTLFIAPNQKTYIGFSYYPGTNSITTSFQKTAEEVIASVRFK